MQEKTQEKMQETDPERNRRIWERFTYFSDAEAEQQQPFACWLHRMEHIKKKTKLALLEHRSPMELYGTKAGELKEFLTESEALCWEQARKEEPERYYQRMLYGDVQYCPFYHAAYPKRLRQIPDMPFGLFFRGRLPEERQKSVAIVGARDCSAYGASAAKLFAKELAGAGIPVISGLARGIDGIAQRAALEEGGTTFAVLGCGADVCYPASNRDVYERTLLQGGILSEYPPQTAPRPYFFPPRNRIISGLSDCVLVVEAGKKSGTLITVDMALEQGREVYAVPGRITDRLSEGCHELLRQGAGIALSPEMLLQELFHDEGFRKTCPGGAPYPLPASEGLPAAEQELLALLDYEPVTVDSLRIRMQDVPGLRKVTLAQTMEMLVNLCLKGKVRQMIGGYGLL